EHLSPSVDKELFLQSQLLQPDLFIRVKRGKEQKVSRELERHALPFRQIGPQAFSLPNGTKLQDVKSINGDYEVQDWSSQRTLEFIKAEKGEYWWDACAGSGGKALMFLINIQTPIYWFLIYGYLFCAISTNDLSKP